MVHRGNLGQRLASKLVKLDGLPLTCTGALTSPCHSPLPPSEGGGGTNLDPLAEPGQTPVLLRPQTTTRDLQSHRNTFGLQLLNVVVNVDGEKQTWLLFFSPAVVCPPPS